MTEPVETTTHPGEVLLEEYARPLGLSPGDVAARTDLTVAEVKLLLAGELSVSPEIADKLARGLGTSSAFWLNLQASYDRGLPVVELASLPEAVVAKVEEFARGTNIPPAEMLGHIRHFFPKTYRRLLAGEASELLRGGGIKFK